MASLLFKSKITGSTRLTLRSLIESTCARASQWTRQEKKPNPDSELYVAYRERLEQFIEADNLVAPPLFFLPVRRVIPTNAELMRELQEAEQLLSIAKVRVPETRLTALPTIPRRFESKPWIRAVMPSD